MTSPKENLLSHPLLASRPKNWNRDNIVGRFWTYQLRIAKWVTHMEVDTDLDSRVMLDGWLSILRTDLAKVGVTAGWDVWAPEFSYFGAWVVVPIRPTLDLIAVFDLTSELAQSEMSESPDDDLIEPLVQPPIMRVRNMETGQSIMRSTHVSA